MATPNFTEDEVFRFLACRPRHFVEGAISLDEPTTSKLELAPIGREAQSSLGALDELPLEIVCECFSHLDIPSLLRLARVSMRTRTLVRSLPTFKRVIEHAGNTFEILHKTQILDRHSIAVLDRALHSDRCVFCEAAFGPYLFLLSAERCCVNCLVQNQSFWMISLYNAREGFGLTPEEVQALPTIRSIPGYYRIANGNIRKRREYLTSARAAKVAAVEHYGSVIAIEPQIPRCSAQTLARKSELYSHLRSAPLQPLSQEYRAKAFSFQRPSDPYSGMGAMPFPALFDGRIERGLWCRGCEFMFEKQLLQGLEPEEVARLPKDSLPALYCETMRYMAFTKSEMADHVKQCLFAEWVISKKWRKGMHERYLSDEEG